MKLRSGESSHVVGELAAQANIVVIYYYSTFLIVAFCENETLGSGWLAVKMKAELKEHKCC